MTPDPGTDSAIDSLPEPERSAEKIVMKIFTTTLEYLGLR